MAMSLEKISKVLVLRLTSDAVHFIVANKDGGGDSHVQVWGQMQTAIVFEDYRLEAAHKNEIWLHMNAENLVRALKSTSGAEKVMMKLTKKGQIPLLCFNIVQRNRVNHTIDLVQEVPVRVLSPQEQELLQEPLVPNPEVHILTPSLARLRNITDKMKSISKEISISANMQGEFIIKCIAEQVQIETKFLGLINPELDPAQVDVANLPAMVRPPNDFATTRVVAKDFSKFLNSYLLDPSNVVCCIIEGHGLVLYVYVDVEEDTGENRMSALTYYLPGRED